MLKLAMAIDAVLLPAMRQRGLPADIVLRAFAFGAELPAGADAVFEIESSRRAMAPEGDLLLGVILPATAAGNDEAVAAIRATLPGALQPDGIFFAGEEPAAGLLDWCWRRICLVTEHLLREYARSHLALAGYRGREQQLEKSLRLAEAAFADFRKEPLKLALRLEPSGVYARRVAPPPGDVDAKILVRQRIPVLLANVVYLDLFFGRDGAGLSGAGRVTVSAAYSGTVICDRQFTFAEIRQGWTRFMCSASELVARQPLAIELELSGAGQADLVPGLASPSPIGEECAFVGDDGSAGRPLAVRIWSGIAGLHYPRHVNALAPAGEGIAAKTETLSLPADVLASAAPHAISRKDVDFTVVSYEVETQSLLVHPLGPSPTVAKISGVQAQNLRSVSALVQLRRFDAQPTDCAILACRGSERPRFGIGMDRGEPIADGTQWLHLRGGEWGEVRCALPEALSGDVDIYLLSRNQTDDYNLSWAFFRGIQLECRA